MTVLPETDIGWSDENNWILPAGLACRTNYVMTLIHTWNGSTLEQYITSGDIRCSWCLAVYRRSLLAVGCSLLLSCLDPRCFSYWVITAPWSFSCKIYSSFLEKSTRSSIILELHLTKLHKIGHLYRISMIPLPFVTHGQTDHPVDVWRAFTQIYHIPHSYQSHHVAIKSIVEQWLD